MLWYVYLSVFLSLQSACTLFFWINVGPDLSTVYFWLMSREGHTSHCSTFEIQLGRVPYAKQSYDFNQPIHRSLERETTYD